MLATTIEAIREDAALPYSSELVPRATVESIVRQCDIALAKYDMVYDALGTADKAIQQVKIDPKEITRLHAKVARARVLSHFGQQGRKHMNEKYFDLSTTRTESRLHADWPTDRP